MLKDLAAHRDASVIIVVRDEGGAFLYQVAAMVRGRSLLPLAN